MAGMDEWRARERVFLGGYSAERVPVSGCSDHLAGMDTVLSGCVRAQVRTIWQAWIQC